jgi:hypothetical protein
MVVAQRMEETAAQLRRMLSPSVEELQALLERLAQEPAVSKRVSAEVQDA